MSVPDISSLAIRDHAGETPTVPDDIDHADDSDRYMQKLKAYAKSVPYSIEPNSRMQELLDLILTRITQCVEAKDYEPGLLQWDTMLSYWSMLKYPIPKEKRIRLARVYFHLAITPGLPNSIIAVCIDGFNVLTRSEKKVSIEDMRLPWKPLYRILKKDLFLTRRQFEYSSLSWCMGYLANLARRFFHPAAIDEMLATFVPLINGSNLDTILASQFYLLTFLPLTHPQSYLPMLFRMWESVNSYMYDDRMIHFLARLAEMHVDPMVSDPERIKEIPDDEKSEGEARPNWPKEDLYDFHAWSGISKDVGIFSDHEWEVIMSKCLSSMQIPLADAGSLTTGPSVDNQAHFEISRLPKSDWRIPCLARIIVYSMAQDGLPTPPSNAPTPFFTPLPSGMNTPQIQNSTLTEFLSAPLRKTAFKGPTYLAGSKALDSLAKLIASTESFFHPSNSGAWTSDLSAFIKYVVYEFNKRWYEERAPDCKTPQNRRLTSQMKRELVKSLRTVALLAMFSSDSSTVSNIQGCLKSMSVMEPDLILHPVLERAIPSLEALVETQRTLAVIKALGAVAPALVSRDVYYSGAKYLVQILQLLIPGIDLNDPSKTLCTTSFLADIAQYIKFGDLTSFDNSLPTKSDDEPMLPSNNAPTLPSFSVNELNDLEHGIEPTLSNEDEDALLRDTTGDFVVWIASFIRRVIQLFENLPEEGANGYAGGDTEAQVVDSVAGACSQICSHLSEPLYDLVLNMVYDYASTNVRSNAVRAIHQLVECIGNANPAKTLAKFLPSCIRNIQIELDHGASSLRTTSASTPLPSDATLHWNLAILRGTVYNDGKAVLKYRQEFMSLFQLLHEKTFSKRGYSWSSKLLSNALLTLTHTYPLENKFVNPEEWNSEEFRKNHHRYWGKLYKADEINLSWHVPNAEEIDFALEIFKQLIEPTFTTLDNLIKDDIVRDATWRNDFCRHLNFVSDAFAGIPTLAKEIISESDQQASILTSDILNEIPEMIASIPALNSGFCLTNLTDPRYKYITSLRCRFGNFLHKASVSLRQQGEENTVDAVCMLVDAVRTYMLAYGGNSDSYSQNVDQYNADINIARLYAGQKMWPRAVLVRRARFYHSARLHWNSIERLRSLLEDNLIDDMVEWSMWQYATVRESAQSLLESLSSSFDGIRRRALPLLYESLKPGTDDDRMKGALWTLNCPAFARYAISEPTLATDLCKKLFSCQHNEKPSIQNCVSALADNCLNNFSEPTFLVYEIKNHSLDKAVVSLKAVLPGSLNDKTIILRCQEKRIERHKLINEAIAVNTTNILEFGNSSRTHWRYSIFAIRFLRTLIRRDEPVSSAHISFFLEKTYDSNSNMRYYAQRGIMKISRNIKLRTLCLDPSDLVQALCHNPLKRQIPVEPSHTFTHKFLENFREPVDIERISRKPIFHEKDPSGWIAWTDHVELFVPPHATTSTYWPWEEPSNETIATIREIVCKSSYWTNLSKYFSEENHENVISQDNVSCVKSIFQLLDDEPFEVLKPTLEELIADKEKDKQRAAAELIAGMLNASKHWPTNAQNKLWEWFVPYIPKIFKNIKTDSLQVWTSFLEYMFYHKDPRRLQPLVDYLMSELKTTDFNAELSFDATKILVLLRAFYSELTWKFSAWTDEVLDRCWPEIQGDHDEVRVHIGEFLAFSDKVKWQPKPSVPTTEVFVRECRTSPVDFDIMGMRGTYHQDRILQLEEQFKVWRKDRVPGTRAFQSTYDRVGITVCKWLFYSVHDTRATSVFDYILPLMPELFRFTEVNDNDDLASRASLLLVRMCGVIPPRALVNPLLDAIFEAIHKSPSWKVRLKALPLLQVFYFRQMPLITDIKITEILEVLCKCLDDEVVEVRVMAATTLSGVIRLSPRRSVVTLKDRFVRLAKNSHIPERNSPAYTAAIRQRHAAILGICALVDSFPYTIEKWMPDLITTVLAEYTYDPIPISTTVRKCASNFRKTHQDTWHEDSKRFDEDQLAALSTLLTGSSYYA